MVHSKISSHYAYPVACSFYFQAATPGAAVMLAEGIHFTRFSWHDTVE